MVGNQIIKPIGYPMTTTFIFVRHGAADKVKNHLGKTVDHGLTPEGVVQAQSAGQWIQSLGITPDLIVHTTTPRTIETAQIIAELYDDAIPTIKSKSGFSTLDGLHKKLEQWTLNNPARVVLFCGHHTSQQVLKRAFRLGLSKEERAVVVIGLPTGESRSIGLK
jgi:broad specificity phosphatase PhoE